MGSVEMKSVVNSLPVHLPAQLALVGGPQHLAQPRFIEITYQTTVSGHGDDSVFLRDYHGHSVALFRDPNSCPVPEP